VSVLRIAVINPNTSRSMTDTVVAAATAAARLGTVLTGRTPCDGPATVETNVDEVAGATAVLAEVHAAEAELTPPDGYVIACFGDTGLAAAKERAAGPVVGMTEAAVLTAALVAYRFCIITMPRRTLAMSDRVVRELGLDHRCVVRAVDEPVAAVTECSLHLLEQFLAEGNRAIADDAAEAIILGCAGLAGLVAPLRAQLGIPVIEGVAAAVGLVEALLAQGLSTSRVNTYGHTGGIG